MQPAITGSSRPRPRVMPPRQRRRHACQACTCGRIRTASASCCGATGWPTPSSQRRLRRLSATPSLRNRRSADVGDMRGNLPGGHSFRIQDNTISSTSVSRRCRFFTIRGFERTFPVRGTLISPSPTTSETTVLDRAPFRGYLTPDPGQAGSSRDRDARSALVAAGACRAWRDARSLSAHAGASRHARRANGFGHRNHACRRSFARRWWSWERWRVGDRKSVV